MCRYALYFAVKLGAPLLGIHAGGSSHSIRPNEFLRRETNQPLFEHFSRDCSNRGVACETLIRGGSWEMALQDSESDMLTLLPFGKRFRLQELDPEKMILSSHLPILFCPDSYIDIESIALAYDGGECSKKALDLAVWLSEKAAWPLTVLMVAESQEQGVRWMDEVETYLDSLTINSTTVILSGDVETTLHHFILDGSVELLIMGACGRLGGHPVRVGRNSAAMIERGRFPLLIVL